MTNTDLPLAQLIGRQVIAHMITAISILETRITEDFALACQACLACQGHVIVMGVGKSGHIAQKIAATLSSTGTPAFFVHPSEAQHGDIGMITKNDMVIMISKSGETVELIALLPVLQSLAIPLVALTGNPNSTIAQGVKINLDVSVTEEACPLGLAPTTSTTCALVFGDALAISVMQQRGFTAKDFARFHPGGNLGKRLLLQVGELMHRDADLPVVQESAELKFALMEMTQKNLGITTVVNNLGILSGVFTDGDVRRAFDNNADVHRTLVHEVMTYHPKIVPADLLAIDALNLMKKMNISALVVVDNLNKPIGIIHIHDILKTGLN